MSMTTAFAELQSANSALQQSIAELVMTVHEDRPGDSDIAAVDALCEVVLEVQASAAAAGSVIDSIADVRNLPSALARVHSATSECALRYWRDLRSHGALSRLRTTARRRGIEWRTWQGSVEQSELRCEAPLQRSMESVETAWREVGELLSLYLLNPTEQPARASASAKPMSARRPS
jgi:hypothetical protein